MPLAFVIFDNDGVLVDTEHLYFEATRSVLAEVGVVVDAARFAEISLRQGLSVLELAAEAGHGAGRVEELRGERNRRYTELLRDRSRLLPRVKEVIQGLHPRVPMGIVTSSRRDHFEVVHGKTELLSYFSWVITQEDVSATKPDPAPYLAALARIGRPPEQIVVVEDSPRGVEAAHAAGLPCIAIPHPWSNPLDFKNASLILKDIAALPEALEQRFGLPQLQTSG